MSSDLVASFFMKPVGAAVHMRRGTVNCELVKWLCVGSVPSAFAGVFVLKALGGNDLQDRVKLALGYALLHRRARPDPQDVHDACATGSAGGPAGLSVRTGTGAPAIVVRPLPTLVIGAVGGLVVGMTSVGSGSLIIIALHRALPGAAGLEPGRAPTWSRRCRWWPRPRWATCSTATSSSGVTASLLVGCMPGVYLGARMSARCAGRPDPPGAGLRAARVRA